MKGQSMSERYVLPLPNSKLYVLITREWDGVSLTVFDHAPQEHDQHADGKTQVYVEARAGEIRAYVFNERAYYGEISPENILMQACPEATEEE